MIACGSVGPVAQLREEPIPGEADFWLFGFWSSDFSHFDPGRAAQRFTHAEGLVGGVQGPDGAV